MTEAMPKPKILYVAILAILVTAIAIAFVLLVFVLPKKEVFAYVKEVGFSTHGHNRVAYLADIYVDDEHVGSIYILIPLYSEIQGGTYVLPLAIHIPMVGDASVKKLRIVFMPPLGEVLDTLAWVVTSFNTDVRFYVDGRNVIWQCDNLDLYGRGTITLEFVPKNPRPRYFNGVAIAIEMLIEYNGRQYIATHSVEIS